MRRGPAVLLVVVVALSGCGGEDASPYLQPDDVGDRLEVVEGASSVPFGSAVPCTVVEDPERELALSGGYVDYGVTDGEGDGSAGGRVMSGAYAPGHEVAGRLLGFLDEAPDACPTSDVLVSLDGSAAAAAAEAAGLPADDVRVVRREGAGETTWRSYAVVEGRVAVLQARGADVVAVLDLPGTVAAAVGRLRDYEGDLPPQG